MGSYVFFSYSVEALSCYSLDQSFNQFSMAGDELNRALLVTIYHMLYLITIEVLHQVFSPHGFVQKIVTFQKSAEFYGACAAIQGLCAGENVIGTSLAVPQTSVFKYENSDGDGGVVEVKRFNNRNAPPFD
ncbi:hypothetical protein PVK06_021083 [Gossypium arboreum]|uniref:PTBP1-like RNA recognition motif 2 domain-containing protein n=1 Tax=Gossypium arboreum TaxID=29729 RepID=A0ABR0PP84_GOSAR|nr:hypothetical protein PVK06_021083 [Gossypium arboreum]